MLLFFRLIGCFALFENSSVTVQPPTYFCSLVEILYIHIIWPIKEKISSHTIVGFIGILALKSMGLFPGYMHYVSTPIYE